MVSLRRFLKCVCMLLPTAFVVLGKKAQEKEPKQEIDKVSDVSPHWSDNPFLTLLVFHIACAVAYPHSLCAIYWSRLAKSVRMTSDGWREVFASILYLQMVGFRRRCICSTSNLCLVLDTSTSGWASSFTEHNEAHPGALTRLHNHNAESWHHSSSQEMYHLRW